jgi:molybdopterin-binding protein
MAPSARNQLTGHIKGLKFSSVTAHVLVQVGENEIESVLTRQTAEEMHLKTGDAVTLTIKPTKVVLRK